MKKIILSFVLVFILAGTASAQVNGKTIGLRFGGFNGYGGEISYQQPLSSANRMELDLGLNYYGFGLSGVYQWVWDLSSLADGFDWYAGLGGSLGSYNRYYSNSPFNVGVLGQIGIEYNFNIPLQLSLDYRPGIYLLNGFYPSYDGICFAARFRF